MCGTPLILFGSSCFPLGVYLPFYFISYCHWHAHVCMFLYAAGVHVCLVCLRVTVVFVHFACVRVRTCVYSLTYSTSRDTVLSWYNIGVYWWNLELFWWNLGLLLWNVWNVGLFWWDVELFWRNIWRELLSRARAVTIIMMIITFYYCK